LSEKKTVEHNFTLKWGRFQGVVGIAAVARVCPSLVGVFPSDFPLV
jgi:hypothetical protein